MSNRNEAGTSLVEIIFAIIVIGLVVSAVVAAISTSENGTAAHRQLVTADHVLRNYAEDVKSTVRATCVAGGTWTSSYSPPSGYTVNALAGQSCPAVTATANVTVQVTTPSGTVKSLALAVRTP